MEYSHIPVLLDEVLSALRVVSGGKYIDCTFGGGGYSRAIAQRGGVVLGMDIDEDVIKIATQARNDSVTVVRENFENVYVVAQREGFVLCQGVVFDLGVSSFQIDTPKKGFSFQKEGPLDMRMDTRLGITAGRLLDILDEDSLTSLFVKFGDEMHARKIARGIKEIAPQAGSATSRARNDNASYWEDKTTTEFAEFVSTIVGCRRERIHPATRVFQALRMAVNDEAGALERGLRGAFDALGGGGRIVVVTFHSVEDRIVKQFIRESVGRGVARSIDTFYTPTHEEVVRNPRSRSAKMRIVEKRGIQ